MYMQKKHTQTVFFFFFLKIIGDYHSTVKTLGMVEVGAALQWGLEVWEMGLSQLWSQIEKVQIIAKDQGGGQQMVDY